MNEATLYNVIFWCIFLCIILFIMVVTAIIAAVIFYARRKPKQEYKDLPKTLTYSGFWRRAISYTIDFLILTALIYLISLGDKTGNGYAVFQPIISLVVSSLYYVLQQSSSYQATLGMRLMGIKIYNAVLEKPAPLLLVGRYFLLCLSGSPIIIGFLISLIAAIKTPLLSEKLFLLAVPPFIGFLILLIGLLMIVLTRRKQALHDKIARTVICRQR